MTLLAWQYMTILAWQYMIVLAWQYMAFFSLTVYGSDNIPDSIWLF